MEIRRRIKKRSPSYPMINLQEAIQKVKALWDKDRTNAIPREVALEHLGYKSQGGYSARVLAALKQFDLITEYEGDIKLTSSAMNLMLYSQSDDLYKETIKKIALNPAIYERIYYDFNNTLPSDATLKAKLISNYEFNPLAVDEFIKNFRESISFLKSFEPDQYKWDSFEVADDQTLQLQTSPQAQPIAMTSSKCVPSVEIEHGQSFRILLKNMETAILSFSKLPVQKKDLDLIKNWIDLMADNLAED